MKKFNWFVRESGHLLAFNGYDYGLNIYDPWNRVYTVNMSKHSNRSMTLYSTSTGSAILEGIGQTLKLIGKGKRNRTKITHKANSYSSNGYVQSNKKKYLFMDHLLGIAIH